MERLTSSQILNAVDRLMKMHPEDAKEIMQEMRDRGFEPWKKTSPVEKEGG